MMWIFLVAQIIATGCSQQESGLSIEDQSNRRQWIAKVAKVLRNGSGITDSGELQSLEAVSDSEVVDRLMAHPDFRETMNAFGIFFQGRRYSALSQQGRFGGKSLNPQVRDFSLQMVQDGNFFALVSKNPKVILTLDTPKDLLDRSNFSFDAQGGYIQPKKIDPDLMKIIQDTRRAQLNTQLWKIDEILKVTDDNQLTTGFSSPIFDFSSAGITDLESYIASAWISPIQNRLQFGLIGADEVRKNLVYLKEALRQTLTEIEAAEIKANRNQNSKAFVSISVTHPDLGPLAPPFGAEQFNGLENSSTNYNRKRASYMLQTYLCDDLTPLAVPSSDEHSKNRHASDPACRACHYKLDPMGALFREHGQVGYRFPLNAKTFVFDDDRILNNDEFKKYLDTWIDPKTQKIEAGFFVSPNAPHPLWKGDQLDDFWDFAAVAPEVKQCMVRRLAEYFLGTEQVYDQEWLEDLSKDLTNAPGSAITAKKIIKALVTSNTFKHPDPVKNECYDFAPNASQLGVPCPVKSVINEHCVACHGNGSKIDFTSWQIREDGLAWFAHVDSSGKQLKREDSVAKLIDRIRSTNPKIRMPLDQTIPDVKRAALDHWLHEERK